MINWGNLYQTAVWMRNLKALQPNWTFNGMWYTTQYNKELHKYGKNKCQKYLKLFLMQDLKKVSINGWPVRMGDASRVSLCCWMGAVRTTYLVFKPLNWYFFNSNKVWEWQLQEFYSWRKLENDNNYLIKWTARAMIASQVIKVDLHTEIQLAKMLIYAKWINYVFQFQVIWIHLTILALQMKCYYK